MGEGEGGKMWENGIETCKISCMKRVASPGSMHDTGRMKGVRLDGRRICRGRMEEDGPGGTPALVERERVGRFGRMALKHVKYHV